MIKNLPEFKEFEIVFDMKNWPINSPFCKDVKLRNQNIFSKLQVNLDYLINSLHNDNYNLLIGLTCFVKKW